MESEQLHVLVLLTVASFFFAKAMTNNALYAAAACDVSVRRALAMESAEALLVEWAAALFEKAGKKLAGLCGHGEGGVAIPAVAALAEVMTVMHECAAQKKPIDLQSAWIQTVSLFSLFSLAGLCTHQTSDSFGTNDDLNFIGQKKKQAVKRLFLLFAPFNSPEKISSEPLDDSILFFVSLRTNSDTQINTFVLFSFCFCSFLNFFKKAVEMLVKEEKAEEIISAFISAFGAFADVRVAIYSSLTNLAKFAESADKKKELESSQLVARIFEFLKMLPPPEKKTAQTKRPNAEGISAKKLFSRQKKGLSELWVVLLKCPISPKLYKEILVFFPDNVLPFLSHPILAVDFFFSAYNRGGFVAMLSLKSLFLISTKINVEVPEFYPKLYKLLTSEIFVSKKKGEFFELVDLFLSSEYLPQFVAAAFAKKLSRLAMQAPAAGAVICLQIIFNLIRRNPNLLFLIHEQEEKKNEGEDKSKSKKRWRRAEALDRRKEKRSEMQDDENNDDYVPEKNVAEKKEDDLESRAQEVELPIFEEADEKIIRLHEKRLISSDAFDDSADDPAVANAMNSQLWELLFLANHCIPIVAEFAAIFSGNMERPLFNISQISNLGTREIIDKMRRKKSHQIPLEHRAKKSLVADEIRDLYFA